MIDKNVLRSASFAKEVVSQVLCALGVDILFRAINRRKILILAYHGVVEMPLDPPCPWMVVEAELARQLKWLVNRYQVMRLDDVVARLRDGQPLPDRVVVLTFDDGYASVRQRALPLLQCLRVPATVFLVTSSFDSPELLWHDQLYLALARSAVTELDLGDDGGGRYVLGTHGLAQGALPAIAQFLKTLPAFEKADVLASILHRLEAQPATSDNRETFATLTAAELEEITQSGWLSVGAHAHHHEILTRLDRESRSHEVCNSMARFQQLLSVQSVPFAYPNGQLGDFDDSLKELIRNSGFSCGVTTISGLNAAADDLFALKRIVVEAGLSMCRFRLRTSGFTERAGASLLGRALSGTKRWRSYLRPLRRWMREVLFKHQTIIIFEREPTEPHMAVTARGRGLSFAPASRSDLDAFACRLDRNEQSSFRDTAARRLDKGMKCFTIKHGEKVVSYSWVDKGPCVFIPEVECVVDIGPGTVYIFDGLTVPEWRGRNLYPHLLSQVCIAHPGMRMVIAASRSNTASRRAIEKAGFRPVEERCLLKVAGIVLQARSREAFSRPPKSPLNGMVAR